MLKEFWAKNEQKIVLVFGFLLIATISFEFGLIQGKKSQDSPLVIEKPAQAQETACQVSSGTPPQAQNLPQETKKSANGANAQPTNSSISTGTNCAFVGSKNSNKFYPPTCSYAKRIKPENVVCFANAQEALAQGRTESTGCTK